MKFSLKQILMLTTLAVGTSQLLHAEWVPSKPDGDKIRFTFEEAARAKYPTATVTFKLIRHVPDTSSNTGWREDVFTQYTLPTILQGKEITDVWYKIRPSDFVYPMHCVEAWEGTVTLPNGSVVTSERGGKIVCKEGDWYRGTARIKFDIINDQPRLISY